MSDLEQLTSAQTRSRNPAGEPQKRLGGTTATSSVIHRHRRAHDVDHVGENVLRWTVNRPVIERLQSVQKPMRDAIAEALLDQGVDDRCDHVADRKYRHPVLSSRFLILHHAQGATA